MAPDAEELDAAGDEALPRGNRARGSEHPRYARFGLHVSRSPPGGSLRALSPGQRRSKRLHAGVSRGHPARRIADASKRAHGDLKSDAHLTREAWQMDSRAVAGRSSTTAAAERAEPR